MYIPKKIVIQNWLSFKGIHEFNYRNGEVVLLQGRNLADDGQESNGSGKSSINDAANFAITGGSMRGVRDIDLITKGETESSISLELLNVKTGITLLISRKIFVKGSSKLAIFQHLKEVAKELSFSSVNEGNKLIFQLLGITIEDFQSHFIVSKDKYTSFFENSDAKKKELISRFSNANCLDDINPYLDKITKNLRTDLKEIQDDEIKCETELNIYKRQLENLDEEVDCSDLESVIVNTQENIQQQTLKIGVAQVEIERQHTLEDACLTKIEQLQKQLSEFKLADHDQELSVMNKGLLATKTSIEKIEAEIKEDKVNLSEFKDIVSELNTKLAGEIVCPKCQNHFIIDETLNIEEAIALLEESNKSIEELNISIKGKNNRLAEVNKKAADIKVRIKELETKIENNKKVRTSILDSIDAENSSLKRIKNSIKNYSESILLNKKNIINFNAQIEKTNKEIEQRKQEANKKQKDDLITKIVVSEASFNNIVETETDLINKISNYERWQILFTKFKSYLANQSLSLIEGYTNMYLKKMNTNLQIRIEGYKTLADGKTTKENITPIVLRNGIEEGHFRKFSGGERGRLEIAIMLALQNLINASSSDGLDLLIVDEVLESVDGRGISSIMDSLDSLNRTIMLTTHVNVQRSHNIIIIEKGVDNVSKIIQ